MTANREHIRNKRVEEKNEIIIKDGMYYLIDGQEEEVSMIVKILGNRVSVTSEQIVPNGQRDVSRGCHLQMKRYITS